MVKEGIVLGHKISKSGIEVDKAKVDVIAKLPHPHYSGKGYSQFSRLSTLHYTEKELLAVDKTKIVRWILRLQIRMSLFVIKNKVQKSRRQYLLSRLENPIKGSSEKRRFTETFLSRHWVMLKYGVTHRSSPPSFQSQNQRGHVEVIQSWFEKDFE
ncbi:hypothetical protein Tco_1114638 [Tanacetum coccineum]|uniref:Uncharacterized protein n=1 Tax=Tanacetum coccineum TaxID=301880 RepID=A0ABQ5IX61_9ASTR